MEDWLVVISRYSVLTINVMALSAIAFGSLQAFLWSVRFAFSRPAKSHELRDGYLHYARWLIVGLTFQLAADVISSAVSPSWQDIGRLAAIAVIRTFLSYFLERDMEEARQLRNESARDVFEARAT